MHKHPEHFDMQVYFESWLFWPRVPRVVPGVVPDCLDPDGSLLTTGRCDHIKSSPEQRICEGFCEISDYQVGKINLGCETL